MNINHRLISFIRDSRIAFGLTVLLGAIGGVLTIAQAQNLSLAVSRVFLENASLGDIRDILTSLVFIIVGRALLVWVGEVSAKHVAVRVKSDLRQRLIAHIVKLGPSYTRSERTGDLAVTAVEHIDALDAYFSQYIPQLILAAVIPLSILIFVFPIDPLSGLILLLTAPLIPLFMILIGRVGEVLTRRQYDTLSRLSAHFLDSLQGLTTLKMFGRSRSHTETIEQVSDEFARTTMSVLRVTFLSALVLEIIATLSTAVIAVEIGLRLLYFKMEFEQAFFLLILAPEFYLPMRMLGTRFHSGISGTTAAKKIFSILNMPIESDIEASGDISPRESSIGCIHFSDVDFVYPDVVNHAVKGANLKIDLGKQIALVGRSGAGKSTLIQLLLRFIHPTRGQILFDGQLLSSIPLDAWRNQLAWVPQNPFIFNASIAENIRLGCPEAEKEKVVEAAMAAHLHSFITSLPDRYDTQVGEGGARLSSGQLRRIALARAFLKDAPILILDEPTSDLDPLLEAKLDQSLRELKRGRTVITIAHRLQTIRRADQIVVMEGGQIIACGTHEELLANSNAYARMMRAQDPPPSVDLPRLSFHAQRAGTNELSISDSLRPLDQRPVNIGLRLLSYLRGSWRRVVFSILTGTATVISNIGLLGTSSWLISSAALHPSIADLQIAIVGVRFFGISRGIFRYLERLTSHDVTFRLLSRLRGWFFTAVEPLAPARLMQYRSGDLLSRVVADVDTLEDFYIRFVAPSMIAIIISISSAFYLGQFSPVLGWILFIFLFVQGVGVPLVIENISRNPGRELVASRALLHAQLVETVQGLADLTAFGRVADRQLEIRRTGIQYNQSQHRMAVIAGLQSGLAVMLTNSGMLVVFIMVVSAVGSGLIPGVMLAALTMIAMASFEAVLPLSLAAQMLGKIIEAARRLFSIVDIQPEVIVHGSLSSREDHSTAVKFSNLSFTYPGSQVSVLKEIEIHLPQGAMLAVVGPSGAGKSTLINLLMRFWEYEDGEIMIGGHSVRDYDPDVLRGLFAVMPQRPFFFNTSVRSNLLLARPDATEVEVVHAAQQAQIHDFISHLPEGYDTNIGEQGLRLSGGERQRLAIARALVRDAPIIIFDEPTANLDPLTEGQLFETIYGLMRTKTREGQNRSSILITHRLIGLENVDEIVVLEQGRIAEKGTHAKLLQTDGHYRRLHVLQNRIFVQAGISFR